MIYNSFVKRYGVLSFVVRLVTPQGARDYGDVKEENCVLIEGVIVETGPEIKSLSQAPLKSKYTKTF